MNITNQMCGIVALLVLGVLFKWRQRVHTRTENVFVLEFITSFCSLILDIFSIVVITYQDYLPKILVELVSKLYLVSLTLVVYFSMIYLAADVYKKHTRYIKVIKSSIIWQCIVACVIMIAPIYFYVSSDSKEIYSYGLAAILTYVGVIIYIGYILWLIVVKGSEVDIRRKRCVCIWMGIWLIAALIQFFFPEMLIVGYSAALGNIVMFVQLENPEFNLDRKIGIFNEYAFNTKTYELHDKKENYSLMAIFFFLKCNTKTKHEEEEKIVGQIVDYLSLLKGVTSYKISDNEVILLYRDDVDTTELYKEIYNSFKVKYSSIASIKFFALREALIVEDSSQILNLFQYVYSTRNDIMQDRFMEIGRKEYDEMMNGTMIEKIVEDAIENDWIKVFYHPIYDATKKRFTSAEALVRIIDDTGKMIPPSEFIPVSERNGSIIRIGRIVFEKVCRLISEVDIRDMGLDYIEVNLSVLQCIDSNLADEYITIMKKYHINPAYINLEITETGTVQQKRNLLRNMNDLIDYGVTFTLDDFGTGQSNLNYIMEMPVKLVKFDKEMLDAYFKEEKAKYIMEAAMHMIHGMSLNIVAEGIETKEQFEAMEAMNIKFMQGYYFAKPMPRDDFVTFIMNKCISYSYNN